MSLLVLITLIFAVLILIINITMGSTDLAYFWTMGFYIVWMVSLAIITFVQDYNERQQKQQRRINSRNVTAEQFLENRRNALKKVQPFLKSYDDILGNLCISNNNVKVNILKEKNGKKKIICLSKIPDANGQKFLLTAKTDKKGPQYLQSYDYIVDNIWNTICLNFNEENVYENIFNALLAGDLDINEVELDMSGVKKVSKSNSQISYKNLLDINSATEKELMALPGINIVEAKKIIKYVEENNGFKTFEEFVKTMKIKKNFIDQIKSVTCINPKVQDIFSETSQDDSTLIEDSSLIPDSQNKRIVDI